ncbi:unnamed protein product [Bursaphelenchus xylophilus]|uniref:(pine wood nematode) hypothetical protein n=1 Tax=Bursaphelenchus xylophilus TaxID=6326 RepID=A0A1I7RRR8_BURXY|nr:unnamed protein product [Bursaphelenchus xylophilus]CAG9123520.1 unnamed protein product [Bursaphelenchus xylophilus]
MDHMDQGMEFAERTHIVGEDGAVEVDNHDNDRKDKAVGIFGEDIEAGLDCKEAGLVADCKGLAVIGAVEEGFDGLVEVQDVGLEVILEKLELAEGLEEQRLAPDKMEIHRRKVQVTEGENKANS